MSRPKSRNVLLGGNGLLATTPVSSKDELLRMKYTMQKPEEAIYAFADKPQRKTYPDYNPWSENDRENKKLVTAECLNSGYFEAPLVPNEYFSARNLIQETLFLSDLGGKLLLHELSLNLTKAYRVRNDAINKITLASHNFKLPPRVTLTALKRDSWLRDLANPETPLESVATKMPHGIRNKVLLDHMCSLKVPVNRALWFIKCVLCSEQLLLRKKFHSRQSQVSLLVSGATSNFPSLELLEGRWIQEWTLQVADYILKFSREMSMVSSPEKKALYLAKFAYLLRLVQALYIELLVDRTYFLSCIVRFLRDGFPFLMDNLPNLVEVSKSEPDDESPILAQLIAKSPVNYGQLLTALTIVKMFWVEALQHDFLCKQIGESLLLHYFLLERVPSTTPHLDDGHISSLELPFALKDNLLALISTSIVAVFRHNSNAFILPDFWPLIGGLLYRILTQSNLTSTGEHRQNFETVFRLINFRNESLMLNMRYTVKDENKKSASNKKFTVQSKSRVTSDPSFKLIGYNATSLNRSSEDTLMFIDQLDQMNLRTSLASSLRPTTSAGINQKRWRINLKILIKWCTSTYRDMGPLSEKILILCNYIKKKVLQPMTLRGSTNLKAEFESEILESIFSLANEPRSTLSMYNLHVLINEFYLLKIISISSYLRKIIACGIFYISSLQNEIDSETQNDPQISFHLSILSNLPVLNNKQHYQILSKWTANGEKISSTFDRGMEISKTYVLQSLVTDSFPEDFKTYLEEIAQFTVGVKFLLLNWLTSQIKTTITQSPKLIHISPSTIARIYEFYACTDTLTVFFKSFVRFLLKNEGKVIIYYLDTLHYIGILLQHHYLLVNFLPGNNPDRVSAAYELYNLIIDAYYDLSSREPDLYNFRPLWEFMNQSVDKKITESVAANQIKLHDPELDKYIFNKETAESPLKVQVPAPRRNQVYSAEQFVRNLNKLLSFSPTSLTMEDISDYCNDVSAESFGISPNSFLDEVNSTNALETLLINWNKLSIGSNERQDSAFFKLLKIGLIRGIKSKQLLSSHLTTLLNQPLNEMNIELFFIKLIFYRILLFEEVIAIIKTEAEKVANPFLQNLSFNLIFGGQERRDVLPQSQGTMFKILQSEFQSNNVEEVFFLAIQKLKAVGSYSDSEIHKQYGDAIASILMPVIINHKHFALSTMSSELSTDMNASMCRSFLKSLIEVSDILSSIKLAPLANEFSLPFLQLWLRALTSNERPSEAHTGKSILNFLDICEFTIDASNSYFGELFNYLEWEEKRKVFDYLETYFLTHRELLTIRENEEISEEQIQVLGFSRKNQQGTELLPVFKDFFKKFSITTTDNLTILFEKFQQFSDLLVSLLELVDNNVVVKLQSQQIHDIISIFSRLLIIHSTSLTEMIAKHDAVHFGFLKNMMVLLNSAYLANGQDKLKILLFDLLLQMKGSLTQTLVATPTEDVMDNSPQTQGSGAKKEPSPEGVGLETTGGANSVLTMSMILNLPEPGMSGYDFGTEDEVCPITLEHEEINHGSDVAIVNDRHLILVPKEDNVETDQDPFKIRDAKHTRQFRMESVGLLEDTTSGLNNGCFSLSMFGAYTTKENPY